MAEDPVHFADANLKAAVESALNVSNPTASDMLALTELNAYNKLIKSLEGLEVATNLRTLQAFGNQMTDISPLSGLTEITFLDLFGNNISDLSPVSGMTKLEYINIEGSRVSDLSPLSSLTSLRRLYLGENNIEDISALSSLSWLRELDIDGNRIQDISVLANLTSLTRLDVTNNPLNQAACDTYIPLIISHNPGIDIEYDACDEDSGTVTQYTLVITSTEGGRVTSPGEGTLGPYSSLTLIGVDASPETGFSFSKWTGSAVDAGKVSNTLSARTTVQVDGRYTLTAKFVKNGAWDVFYVDDNAPDDPVSGDLAVSDPWENGTIQHPFDSIQEAIDLAVDGYVIQVQPGTYYESIDFLGKAIEIRGMDPNDSQTGELPLLYGLGDQPAIRFTETVSGLGSVLKGMAVVGSKGSQAAAVECIGCMPTLINCLITGNYSSHIRGGAVFAVDCNVMIMNSTIADNTGGVLGGGLVVQNSQVLLLDSIVWGNTPRGISADATSLVVSQFCDIQTQGPGQGNIVADPLFVKSGTWVHRDAPTLVLTGASAVSVWLPGDYHLKSQNGHWDAQAKIFIQDDVTSPCIDAGSDTTFVGQETNPHGYRLNQGVYGGSVFASRTHTNSLGFIIKDETLKIAIMEILGLWSEPDEQDMLSLYSLVDYAYTYFSGIKDLTGLEYAYNLQVAKLPGNDIEDLSPLANLTHLQELNVSDNKVTSIQPLSGLTSLKSLDVHGNRISDMSPVENLTQLEALIAGDNDLSGDLGFLNHLTHLTTLDLQGNEITNIDAIGGLSKLRELDLSDNPFYSISALSSTTELEKVDLSYTRVEDLGVLTGLTHLTQVTVEGNFLGQKAYSSDLQAIEDHNPAVDLKYGPNQVLPSVSASDGLYSDRVQVTWTEVDNGPKYTTYYQVSRSDISASGKTALSPWQTSQTFNDTTAVSGKTYDYFVRTAVSAQGAGASYNYSSPDHGSIRASGTPTPSPGSLIKDENLKIAIMEILGLWSEPDEQDMLSLYSLVDYTYTYYSGIKDLTGLEYAYNLQVAELRGNEIEDLSPLANLTYLQGLNVSENKVTSIAPLSGLTSLKRLDVHENGLSDMSPVANLTQLEELTARYNDLSDLSFLNHLTNLTRLDLQNNEITNIDAIGGLSKLRELDLSENPFYSISALSSTTELEKVDLSYTRVYDIGY